MVSSFRIGRIFGIDIGVHWSWIFIFFIVTWLFATGVFEHFYPEWSGGQRWAGGAVVAGIFFISILLHELSHALVATANGLPVRGITLFVFGGVSNLSAEPDSAALEFKIAAVGPATSLALGALFAAGWAIIRPFDDGIAGISANLALINTALAVFNMLPGFPLDGGRVFRAIIWSRNRDRLAATRTASRVGEWIAYGIMGIGVVYVFFGSLFSGIWFLLIGFFLRNASSASYEQLVIETTLSGINVRDVMKSDVPTVPSDLPIEELVQEHVLRRNARCFAVVDDGRFSGLITLTDVRNIARDDWPHTTVAQAMTPPDRLHSVAPSENLAGVLQRLSEHDVNQLPVIEGGRVLGLITRGDMMRFIQVRRDLAEMLPEAAGEAAEQAERPRAASQH
jgi:Zn-dependent protease